jgi:hypothetical protein
MENLYGDDVYLPHFLSPFGRRKDVEQQLDFIKTALDSRMRVTPRGFPYWYARDVMEILSYARWENFREVIEKAMLACDNSGKVSSHHFRYMAEMIEAGKGAKKKRENAVLS